MAKAITNYLGPGGAMKCSFGTATVGDTVQSRLSYIEAAFVTYNEAMSGTEDMCNTETFDKDKGTFDIGGEAAKGVFWLAIGY